ncbi:Protein of unknown function [Pyronema omphalodes CBS 100304]|uniref:Uncharacterized protein n=1 Tax=Pyronema omphalodes (strain CBS 100304) TaxID=1076935 RepID=U4L771_PYROM|nr:Protein of unknown function [Pyronema omphalodes CBS 100304]
MRAARLGSWYKSAYLRRSAVHRWAVRRHCRFDPGDSGGSCRRPSLSM